MSADYRKQIREARLANNITITEMSRRTGIPRWQYQKFEEGAQVGTARLEAIVEAIPNLPPLHFRGTTLVVAKSDLEEMYDALAATADRFQSMLRELQQVIEDKIARADAGAAEPDLTEADDEVIEQLTAEEYRLRQEEETAERKKAAARGNLPAKSVRKNRGREKRATITPR